MVALQELLAIRPMQIGDLDRVMAIEESAFSSPWSVRSYRFELLENSASHQWVAEIWQREGKEIIGMLVAWLLVGEAYIANIAIAPEFRRRGAAKRLLCSAIATMAEIGAVSASLEVRAGNIPAQSLYRSFGFREVEHRKSHYRDNGEDAIVMRLPAIKSIRADCENKQDPKLWRTS